VRNVNVSPQRLQAQAAASGESVNSWDCAMERGELGSHPLERIGRRVPKQVVAVDPRVVANPQQAHNLLNAVSYVGGYRRARGRRLVGSSRACTTRACVRRRR